MQYMLKISLLDSESDSTISNKTFSGIFSAFGYFSSSATSAARSLSKDNNCSFLPFLSVSMAMLEAILDIQALKDPSPLYEYRPILLKILMKASCSRSFDSSSSDRYLRHKA